MTIKQRISGDDVLLLQLIKKKTNWKIRFAPSSRSFNWTPPERTLKSFLNQRKRWASNGSYQFHLNKFFFLFIVTVFVMNTLVLVGTPAYAAMYHSIALPLGCFAVKVAAEMVVIAKGSRVYQRTDLLKYFPVWVFVQIPYVIFTGLLGSLGHFIWKDRKHIQELTIFRTDH
jgi:cellulose synthase/poly-beta-1,6-N-acetylglucosamine synthase-like glycosyltransferase